MKKCFLLLAATVLALTASAADYFNIVTIHLKDSSKVELLITNKVKLSFTDTHLVVDGTGSEVAIERSNLDKFTHSYDANASLDEISVSDSMQFMGDKAVFYGLPANSAITVYSTAGKEVMSTVAEGDYELSLAGLGRGVYIITANGNSFKVTVK